MADKKPGPHKDKPRGWWHEAFFAKYREFGQIYAAAKAAGVHHTAVSYAKRYDPEFSKRCLEIEGAILDLAESELVRRAIVGVKKGVWHQGVKVGEETVYSDTLLIFMLKKWYPEKYADNLEKSKDEQPLLTEDAKRVLSKLSDEIESLRIKKLPEPE